MRVASLILLAALVFGGVAYPQEQATSAAMDAAAIEAANPIAAAAGWSGPAIATGKVGSWNAVYYRMRTEQWTPTKCAATTATVLCLQGGRFEVATVVWPNNDTANRAAGAVPYKYPDSTGLDVVSDQAGIFWFFDPGNAEITLKVLDGCQVNKAWWVFFSATTDRHFSVTVADMQAGLGAVYTSTGPSAPVQDTSALKTCP